MAFTIPDKGEGQVNLQSVWYQEDIDIFIAGINGIDCVLSGGAVTAQASPDMTVAVAKAGVLTNGVLKAVAAANATITAADATNPRWDLVVIDSSGAIAVRAGTPAAAPKPPVRTANDVVLATVYVPATDTTIASNQIVDKRVIRQQGPITIAKVTSPVTFNNTNVIQTYLSVTIPSGLFLAARILRVRCHGNYLMNSGSPTISLRLSYGGTTMFDDTSGAYTADVDRGAWRLDVEIAAQANNDQALVGTWNAGVLGAKTAPTTGFGDQGGSALGIFGGSAAVDSDAADRTLTVQFTMSVANAANEIVMEYAVVELI